MTTTETTPLLVDSSHTPVANSIQIPKSPLEGQEFSFKTASRNKKFIFVSLAFVNFCASCCFSLLAPFFPVEAGKKGASQTVVGLIFGAFELVIVISSPIFGNFITQIGSKFMFVSGIMVCGVCAILFGLLDKCPDGTTFIVMCFLCRSVEALGASAFVTSLFAIMAHEFPDNVITVMGTLETFSGIGMMVGPPIGGALYQLGGYGLPFFVMGIMVILCGTVTAWVMPPIVQGEKMYTGSILTLLSSPLVIVTLINIAAGSIALGFMDPTLANHLQQFDLKTVVVGLIFLIAPAVYALTAPVWGYIGDKKGYLRLMIGGGSLGGSVALLLLGPAPFLQFLPSALYVNVIAMLLIGLFVGCQLIPTFKTLLIGSNMLGLPNDLDTYGKCSGFFNCSFSLGAFLGPTIGGTLSDKFGFPWACCGISGIFVLAAVLMMVHSCMLPILPTQSPTSVTIAVSESDSKPPDIPDISEHTGPILPVYSTDVDVSNSVNPQHEIT